jgi:hypothetical protein
MVNPSGLIPAVTAKNAPANTILAHAQAFSPAIPLSMPSPLVVGQLSVYRPLANPTPPLDALATFNFKVDKVIKSTGQARLVAYITADKRIYLADYRAKSFGYQLKLTLMSGATPVQPVGFNPVGSANLFLSNHQLTGDLPPQCAGATELSSGSIVVTCTENEPLLVVGAGATFTFTASGVLSSVDVVWVDTSSAQAYPGITFDRAVSIMQSGGALITTSGGPPQPATPVTASIVYMPLNGPGGIYYEPVYQFSGVTAAGGAFQIYVPAFDSSLYATGG